MDAQFNTLMMMGMLLLLLLLDEEDKGVGVIVNEELG
jgi:hypothetical protein